MIHRFAHHCLPYCRLFCHLGLLVIVHFDVSDRLHRCRLTEWSKLLQFLFLAVSSPSFFPFSLPVFFCCIFTNLVIQLISFFMLGTEVGQFLVVFPLSNFIGLRLKVISASILFFPFPIIRWNNIQSMPATHVHLLLHQLFRSSCSFGMSLYTIWLTVTGCKTSRSDVRGERFGLNPFSYKLYDGVIDPSLLLDTSDSNSSYAESNTTIRTVVRPFSVVDSSCKVGNFQIS